MMITIQRAQYRLGLTIMLPLFFLGMAIVGQLRFDAVWQEHFDLREPVHRFVMPAPIVRHFAFGFDNMLADYYWITAIQDLSKWDRHDAYYPEYFRIISALDRRFVYPYHFAIFTVPSKYEKKSLEWLSIIAEEGIRAFPLEWEIPFYAAVQFHVIGRSVSEANHYMELAASIPGSPEMVRRTYATYLMHDASEYQRSRALFSAIYETTEYEETRAFAKERIALLDFIEAVDRAGAEYKKSHHVYPDSLESLKKAGLIDIPSDIIKRFPIVIDPTTGKAALKDIRI